MTLPSYVRRLLTASSLKAFSTDLLAALTVIYGAQQAGAISGAVQAVAIAAAGLVSAVHVAAHTVAASKVTALDPPPAGPKP